MSTTEDNHFTRKINVKAERKLKAQRQAHKHVWFGLGMLGVVGWSIVVPGLLGLLIGLWLDNCCPGHYLWALNLFLVGMFLGCINACHWMMKEHKAIHDDEEKLDD